VIMPPERSLQRDAVIDQILPYVPELGWTIAALHRVGGEAATRLFPDGGPDLIEAYIDLTDRRMAETAAPLIADQRVSQRVRTLIQVRLELSAPHKHAVRRAALILALPANAALAARCTARTIDAIWHAAGDTSADFSWYSKRAILAGVYSATLFFWLNESATHETTLAFLDRRLAGVARFSRLTTRLRQGSSSFLKKRTKKLLLPSGAN